MFDAGSIAGDIALDLSQYLGSIDHAVEAGSSASGQLSGEMNQLASSVSGPLTEAFHGLEEAIAGMASGNAEQTIAGIKEAVGGLVGTAEQAVGALAGMAGAGPGVSEALKGVGDAIEGIASGNPAEIFEGIAEALAGLYEIANGVAERFHEMGLAAQRAGTDVEWMSGMSAVAERANIGVDSLVSGFKILEQRAELASEGNAEAAKGFERLGISVQEAGQLMDEPQKLFERVQQSIGEMSNPSERTAAALGVLGRAGFNLVPILSQSAESIQRMTDMQKALGANVTDENEKQGQSWKEMTVGVSEAFEGIEKAIAGPVLQYVSDHIDDIIQGIKDSATVIKDVAVPAVEGIMLLLEPFIAYGEEVVSIISDITEGIGQLFGATSGGGSIPDFRASSPNAVGGGGGGNITTGDIHIHNEAADSTMQLADKLKRSIRDQKASSDAETAAAARQRAVEHSVGGGSW
jgi:hypothetical protein